MSAPQYLIEFSSSQVQFIEKRIGQLANEDYSFWYFQFIPDLKFQCL